MTSHTPSSSHQSNKSFSRRHRSKGAIKTALAGRVSRPSSAHSGPKTKSIVDARINRKNAAKIMLGKKKEAGVEGKRIFMGKDGIPKTGVVVALCPNVDASSVVPSLFESVDLSMDCKNSTPVLMDLNARFKQSIQWLILDRQSSGSNYLLNVLDACKASDFILFVLSAEEEVDALGFEVLAAIRAQGMLSAFAITQHTENLPLKKINEVKKSLGDFMEHELAATVKIHFEKNNSDCLALLRAVCDLTPKTLHWREANPFMIANNVEFVSNEYNAKNSGTLIVTGYSRGRPFSADRLVHIGTFGDFALSKIDVINSRTLQVSKSFLASEACQEMIFENQVENFDESDDAQTRSMKASTTHSMFLQQENMKKVPVGTSSYQAEWLDEEDIQGIQEEVDSHSCKAMEESMNEFSENENEQEFESITMQSEPAELDEMDPEEAAERLEGYLSTRKNRDTPADDLEFPDEVQTPTDIAARFRFRKYRGLKSFRTSSWDHFENLPEDYQRIFQFDSFTAAKKGVADFLDEESSNIKQSHSDTDMVEKEEVVCNGPPAGNLVVLQIKNVPLAVVEFYQKLARPLVISGLLPHEEKMSVVNMSCFRPSHRAGVELDRTIVKNKDTLIIQCGFRRYTQSVILSQHSTNKLHKTEKFLHAGSTVVASVYAPVQMSCPPALFFLPPKENKATVFIASGSFLNADPNRMNIKRIILTGIPTRIHPSQHRNTAVIRFMFFNSEDVEYFKPIELKTKLGRRGHILSGIGTHGVMKCGFDKPLKSHDTICLYLYKRIYPKWPQNGYASLFGLEAASREISESSTNDQVMLDQ